MRRTGPRELPRARWRWVGVVGDSGRERSWGKHGVVSSLCWMEWEWEISREPSIHYSTYYSFSTIPLHLLNSSPSILPWSLPSWTWTWSRGVLQITLGGCFLLFMGMADNTCVCVFEFKGPEPSVTEQVQDFLAPSAQLYWLLQRCFSAISAT